MHVLFRRFAAVMALILLAPAAWAAVGTINALEGDVRITTSAGDRAAQSGMELNEGDALRTGPNAWALLAMSDGASLTLRPDTQLKIDRYRYDIAGNTADNSSALSLLKGALRAVTGYIGRSNREGYRIITPTATIGIRGTDHEPAYFPPAENSEKMDHEPGTYDKVNEGESVIRNPRGETAVKSGQQAFVHHSGRSAPRLLIRAPAFYKRHAEFDRKAESHRKEFHRNFEERHQKRLQEIRQRSGEPAKRADEKSSSHDPARRNEAAANAKSEARNPASQNEKAQSRQERRHEQAEKRQQEQQAVREQNRQNRMEEKKKREAERDAHHEQKKEHEKGHH